MRLKLPAAGGVPVIAPVAGSSARPAAVKLPDVSLQVNDFFPPVTASLPLYALPCVPAFNDLVLMLTAA